MITRAAPPGTEQPSRIDRLFKGEIEDVNKSKRTVLSIITTDRIDRYYEVIPPKGIDLTAYRENPVVLWCHCGAAPIGKNLWIKRFTANGKSGLKALTKFARTDLAEEILQLYVDEILNGWSIGANPDYKACGPPTEEEIKARPELKGCRCIYRKVELVEYSAVSIPANPDALGNEATKNLSATLRRQLEDAEPWPGAEDEQDDDEPTLPLTKKTTLPPLIALPPLLGKTLSELVHETRSEILNLTSRPALERAAEATLDRIKGRP